MLVYHSVSNKSVTSILPITPLRLGWWLTSPTPIFKKYATRQLRITFPNFRGENQEIFEKRHPPQRSTSGRPVPSWFSFRHRRKHCKWTIAPNHSNGNPPPSERDMPVAVAIWSFSPLFVLKKLMCINIKYMVYVGIYQANQSNMNFFSGFFLEALHLC